MKVICGLVESELAGSGLSGDVESSLSGIVVQCRRLVVENVVWRQFDVCAVRQLCPGCSVLVAERRMCSDDPSR